MEPFTVLTAIAAPLMRDNINTDIIIPMERLVLTERGDFAPSAFAAWRYRADGSEDPDFILNRAPFRNARILLAGDNFGCGSSREPAVWALGEWGIRCVIAPSFGAIFYNNCFQNGLLPIVLARPLIEDYARRIEAAPAAARLTVDLERCVVVGPDGAETPFTIPAPRRECLLHGLDDIALTLRREAEIDAFQAADRQRRPWIYV
jgi:3-isopropylmalate/(R)-2-methylmalate dehydratase small subunit